MYIEFLKNYGPDSAKYKLNDEYVNICYLIWCTIISILSVIGNCCMFVTLFVLFIVMVYSTTIAPVLTICHYFIPDLFMFKSEDNAHLGFAALITYAFALIVYLIVKGVKYITETDVFDKIKNTVCVKVKIK